MNRRPAVAALLSLALAAAPVPALAAEAGSLHLMDARVRASLGVNPNTAGYLTIHNAGAAADALVGASCTCAREVQLHLMTTRGGIMKMEKADALTVAAGGQLALKPGGAHLMILGVKAPLKAGQSVEISLRFRKAGTVKQTFRVVADPGGDHGAHKGH
ncbi:MAG TPA: copper chaperone PCu(A)C [Caulobacteraceae bacterium]|nr:copper chaperone PCu(A)C [Caulobacteraceae bacterium]